MLWLSFSVLEAPLKPRTFHVSNTMQTLAFAHLPIELEICKVRRLNLPLVDNCPEMNINRIKTPKIFNQAKLPLREPRNVIGPMRNYQHWPDGGMSHDTLWNNVHSANHNSHKFRSHLWLHLMCIFETVARIFTAPSRFPKYFWQSNSSAGLLWILRVNSLLYNNSYNSYFRPLRRRSFWWRWTFHNWNKRRNQPRLGGCARVWTQYWSRAFQCQGIHHVPLV